jgi:dihydropteroate synthase
MTDSSRVIHIMGIVNLTDDSFYGPSRIPAGTGSDVLHARIASMLSEGADIIDLGACSTRPGSEPVGEDEEWRRFKAVLPGIRNSFPQAVLSLDTYWPSVIRKAYDLVGPVIVNDVTAAGQDCAYGSASMLTTAAELGLTYVAMHWSGDTSMTPSSESIVDSVIGFFERFASRAEAAGLQDWWLDPGFGFSKTVEQNYELLRALPLLKERFGRPMLVGVSRKSFIYKPLGITAAESLSATQLVHMSALQGGADILRVHDVAEAVRTVKLYRLL